MCLFCKIVAGEIPAKVVLDEDEVLAFQDLRPVAPTHVLVIPKRHVSSLSEATDDDALLLGKLLRAADRVARAAGIADGGYRVVVNNGDDAGQSVHHIHVHVLGGRAMSWPPG